jgi:hypothetical protein
MTIKSLPLLLGASTAFLIFATLLIRAVLRLLRSNRTQIVAAGPLVAEQQVSLTEPQSLRLLLEVPRFAPWLRQLAFEVIELATAKTTALKYDFLRAQGAVYGLTTMRLPLGTVIAERPGEYLVRVIGLEPGKDYGRSKVLLSRPYLGRMILQILTIVFCGVGLLGSLILALWQLFPLQGG